MIPHGICHHHAAHAAAVDQLSGQRGILQPCFQHRRWATAFTGCPAAAHDPLPLQQFLLDMDGHHIYIKDGDTVWNPAGSPPRPELDSYTCRHGLGYTIIRAKRTASAPPLELFVPKGRRLRAGPPDAAEQQDRRPPKELDVFSYVEFCLWDAMDDSTNFQRNFSTGEVEVERVIYHKTEYRERRDHYACSGPTPQSPASTPPGTPSAGCTAAPPPAGGPRRALLGSIAHGWAPVGACTSMSPCPGEEKSIIFGLGYIENPQEENSPLPASSIKPAPRRWLPLCHRRAGGCRPCQAGTTTGTTCCPPTR